MQTFCSVHGGCSVRFLLFGLLHCSLQLNTFSIFIAFDFSQIPIEEKVDGKKTVEHLRGRLLAERAASRAAREEGDLLSKRVLLFLSIASFFYL